MNYTPLFAKACEFMRASLVNAYSKTGNAGIASAEIDADMRIRPEMAGVAMLMADQAKANTLFPIWFHERVGAKVPRVFIGELICSCLEQAGISYQWSGDKYEAIVVNASDIYQL